METKPCQIVEVKGGWAAVAKDWAVFAQSKDEVLAKYQAAEEKHEEILKREAPTSIVLTSESG